MYKSSLGEPLLEHALALDVSGPPALEVLGRLFLMVYGIRRTPRLRISATTTLAYLCGVARNEWRWSQWRRAREADGGRRLIRVVRESRH